MFQGVQSIALQMAQEFGFTREIEDRVQAPVPDLAGGGGRRCSRARFRECISAIIVLPIASVVHAAGVRGSDLTCTGWSS